MCPHPPSETDPIEEPVTGLPTSTIRSISAEDFAQLSTEEKERLIAEREAELAKKPMPPELRRKLLECAQKLADLKAERDSWLKTALALELAEVKKPEPKGVLQE